MQSVNFDPFSEQVFPLLVRRIAALDLGEIGTPERLAAMSSIVQAGSLSVSALAADREVSAATMSRMVTSLFEHGLITRTAHATDGRGCLVSATRKGLKATERAQRIYRRNIMRIVAAPPAAAGI